MICRLANRGVLLQGLVVLGSALGCHESLGAQTPAAPAVSAAQVAATTVVRTTRDRVLVWARDPSRVIATLPQGVALDAVARDAQWIEVRLPEAYGGPGDQRGFVFEGHVAFVSGPALSTLPGRSRAAAQEVGATPRSTGPAFRHPWLRRGRVHLVHGRRQLQGDLRYVGWSVLWRRSAGPFRPDLRRCRRVPVQEDRRARVRVRGRCVSRRHSRSHHHDADGRHRRLPLPGQRPQRALPRWRSGLAEVRGDLGLRRCGRERERAFHELSRRGRRRVRRPLAGCSWRAKCGTRRSPMRWAPPGSPPSSTSRTSADFRWR